MGHLKRSFKNVWIEKKTLSVGVVGAGFDYGLAYHQNRALYCLITYLQIYKCLLILTRVMCILRVWTHTLQKTILAKACNGQALTDLCPGSLQQLHPAERQAGVCRLELTKLVREGTADSLWNATHCAGLCSRLQHHHHHHRQRWIVISKYVFVCYLVHLDTGTIHTKYSTW